MRNLEITLIGTALVGVTFRLLHLQGSGLFIGVSMLLLSVIYLVFGFAILNNISLKGLFKKSSYVSFSILRIVFTILYGIVLSALVIGILFKIQHFPGGDLSFWFSIPLLVIGLFVATFRYVLESYRPKSYYPLLIRSLFWGAPAVAYFILGLKG